MIEAGTRPRAAFAPELSQYTEAALNNLSVEVRTGNAMIGALNRFAVALSWLWGFLPRQHGARLIMQRETLKDA
ncbi:hypothetical protein LJR255_005438 [Pararhizobium sp. LjRoot255]|uniref:hypothetical protein n=1 Tax=Pararhizobium sp. LjRoot255 TaxID=3342298 RepID=UPI003ECD3199